MKRNEVFQLRLSPEEKKALLRCARLRGVTPSQLIRDFVSRLANRIDGS